MPQSTTTADPQTTRDADQERRSRLARLAAALAVLAAVVIVAIVLFTSGGGYTVSAVFPFGRAPQTTRTAGTPRGRVDQQARQRGDCTLNSRRHRLIRLDRLRGTDASRRALNASAPTHAIRLPPKRFIVDPKRLVATLSCQSP